ncbi:TPR domain-containing protein [Pochonia chlamydosporia 170]|uniref:TPR domain-containing protein n=1 Tax=Pochonia chlamydosporia 170 TaxID=1380566 RepID=A0A179F030_METCM|nr:TPR domain-containing protein [Pochonia chlamydosporia 170]OAQ58807.1 TPR domain-containing protein [Pochonia chlamydosporia 170]
MSYTKYPFNLGQHGRRVSTASPEAQGWFNLGLNWCLGFNHEEAIVCFENALNADPNCVMAHWGVAYASGPFYNLIWREMGEHEAAKAITRARNHISTAHSLATHATAVENALVKAIEARFKSSGPVPVVEYDQWDDDYAAAMRCVCETFPEDDDVMALFVEALITRTPRRLWDMKTGLPAAGADTLEAMAICKKSIAHNNAVGKPQHPGILHLYIHVMEMSHSPEDAMASADTLTTLCPDAGHLNHMPGHVFMLCGQYEKAKKASEAAILADDMYAAHGGSNNFYVTARCHDIHLMMSTCMFLGQYEPAMKAARKMRSVITRDILTTPNRPKLTMLTEGYYAMAVHVLVRFGRWQDIIDAPLPDEPELYLITTAMQHYARGVAYASLKKIEEAERERTRFQEGVKRVPPERRFLNNPAVDMLAVGESMLNGELEYHKGNYSKAYEHLREAVRRDDNLRYTEPWAWMHPPRHALGALLLAQGHVDEAEKTYRGDLGLTQELQRCSQHPDNIWSLRGLVECLERRGETDELPALREKLANVVKLADVEVPSSCMCRT